MSNSWNNISEFWDKKYGLTINTLNKGATQDEINILESYIGHNLPDVLIAIYKKHNGYNEYIIYPHPSRFFSTEEIY